MSETEREQKLQQYRDQINRWAEAKAEMAAAHWAIQQLRAQLWPHDADPAPSDSVSESGRQTA